MEKLQNALKKARQQRQMGGATSDAPNLATRKKRELSRIIPVDNMLANTWAVLRSFEPDAKYLQTNRVMTLNAQSKANPIRYLAYQSLSHDASEWLETSGYYLADRWLWEDHDSV